MHPRVAGLNESDLSEGLDSPTCVLLIAFGEFNPGVGRFNDTRAFHLPLLDKDRQSVD